MKEQKWTETDTIKLTAWCDDVSKMVKSKDKAALIAANTTLSEMDIPDIIHAPIYLKNRCYTLSDKTHLGIIIWTVSNKEGEITSQTRYMNIQKSEIESDGISHLAVVAMRLENREIDLAIINKYPFTREALEMKTGRFNKSKAIRLLTWAYNYDIMHELINSTL